jgi:dephospho-CoA kinase
MARIAVTGGIAEGKSTVLGYLRELGADVLSSDDLARRVMTDPDVREEIRQELGDEAAGDRTALRRLLGERPQARRTLNRITHPRIVAEIVASPAEYFEVPLLLESCLQGSFDRVWVVTCGFDEQVRRLVLRVGDEAEARRLIATQLASSAKEVFADLVVRTNAPEETVREVVAEAIRRR